MRIGMLPSWGCPRAELKPSRTPTAPRSCGVELRGVGKQFRLPPTIRRFHSRNPSIHDLKLDQPNRRGADLERDHGPAC